MCLSAFTCVGLPSHVFAFTCVSLPSHMCNNGQYLKLLSSLT